MNFSKLPQKYLNFACCFGLVGIAILLRVGALAPHSLWRDDAWQTLVIKAENWQQVARMGLTGPGFAIFLAVWLGAIGFSSLAAQIVPFVAGIAGPSFVFLLARRLGLQLEGSLAAG